MDSSWNDWPATGVMGIDVSMTESKKQNTYISVGWWDGMSNWAIEEDVGHPFLERKAVADFPGREAEGAHGEDVPEVDAKKKETYTDVGWEFTDIFGVWMINEGSSYPYIFIFSQPVQVFKNGSWVSANLWVYKNGSWIAANVSTFNNGSWS